MEQNFTASLRDFCLCFTFKRPRVAFVSIDFRFCLSRRFIWPHTVCCIKYRLSISQLKSFSQDSFPAGLKSSVVPLHPVDFRSTHACQTEYTLITPDWNSSYFFSYWSKQTWQPIYYLKSTEKCWGVPISIELIIVMMVCSCTKWQRGHFQAKDMLMFWGLSACGTLGRRLVPSKKRKEKN